MFSKDGTAQGVAKQRLIESLAPADTRVIYAPYAENFVLGARLIKLMGHKLSVALTNKFAPGFHQHLIARTRYIDELVEKTAAQGVEQYVILGAGYDTRAHRLTLPSSLTVWEVDQPEVQTIKRAKLAKAQAPSATSAQIHYVSIDFNHQCLSEQLLAAGFDTRKSTLFTLEGVSQYITKETFASTLQEIAALTQNTTATFIFSYVDALLRTDPERCFGKGYPKAKRRAEMVMGLAAKVGEPWISLYTEEALVELLAEHGFSVQENKTLDDLNAVYFSPVGRTLAENQIFKLEHFVAATSKKA